MNLVPEKWQRDFDIFCETGEASPDFLAFIEQDADCKKALEMFFRADDEIKAIIEVAMADEADIDAALAEMVRQSINMKK